MLVCSSSSVCLRTQPLLQNPRCRRRSSSSICLRVLALQQLSRGLQAQVLAQFLAPIGSSRDRLPVLRT
jgi:hypothetical protein